jgi:8-oxo-dGTP diphosphatase
MKLNDARYRNQGIHVDIVVFTLDEGRVKVLLVKRATSQFKGEWIIPGGAVYNNESIDAAAKRELFEKTGLKNVYIEQFSAFGEPRRDPRKRMVSIAYIALIDYKKVSILQKTPKTIDAEWFDVTKLPKMAFDHNEIVKSAFKKLQKLVVDSNIAYTLFPNTFTLPDLQKIYEIILGRGLDRRNFRRKFLKLGLIEHTGEHLAGNPNRPAKLYKFRSNKYQEIDIF